MFISNQTSIETQLKPSVLRSTWVAKTTDSYYFPAPVAHSTISSWDEARACSDSLRRTRVIHRVHNLQHYLYCERGITDAKSVNVSAMFFQILFFKTVSLILPKVLEFNLDLKMLRLWWEGLLPYHPSKRSKKQSQKVAVKSQCPSNLQCHQDGKGWSCVVTEMKRIPQYQWKDMLRLSEIHSVHRRHLPTPHLLSHFIRSRNEIIMQCDSLE